MSTFVGTPGIDLMNDQSKIEKVYLDQETRELGFLKKGKRLVKKSDYLYFEKKILSLIKDSKKNVKLEEERLTSINEEGENLTHEDLARNQLDKTSVMADLGRAEKLLRDRNNAYSRIKNKTFGICYITAKAIEFDRLDDTPHLTTSIEGAGIKENK